MSHEEKINSEEIEFINDKLKKANSVIDNEANKAFESIKKALQTTLTENDGKKESILMDYEISRLISGPLIDRYMYPEVFLNEDVSRAKLTYEILLKKIKIFESTLDFEHEIGAQLITFGREFTFNIQNIDWEDPDILVFEGITQEGKKVQLIQNVAQLNILFISLPKIEAKPKRLGFLSE